MMGGGGVLLLHHHLLVMFPVLDDAAFKKSGYLLLLTWLFSFNDLVEDKWLFIIIRKKINNQTEICKQV